MGVANDAVHIDVERDLDLRNAFGCGRDADEVEVAEELVVAGEPVFSLEDLDLDGGLTVGCSREGLWLLGEGGRAAGGKLGHDAAEGFNTEGKRGGVQQQNVSNAAGQDSALNSCANGNGFIRVDALVGLTAKAVLKGFDGLGHTRHTANKDGLLDVVRFQAGVVEGLLAGIDAALNERADGGLELGTEEFEVGVLGTRSTHADGGEVDLRLSGGGELDLSFLGGLANTLNSHSVTGEVDTGVLLELGKNVLDEGDVEALATKVSVSIGGLDFKDAALEFEDGDIEGSTAQVVDSHDVFTGVHTASKSSSGRLVDDAENVKTSNLSGILGCLPLSVFEVGRDGDDGVLGLLSEVLFSGFRHLDKDHK